MDVVHVIKCLSLMHGANMEIVVVISVFVYNIEIQYLGWFPVFSCCSCCPLDLCIVAADLYADIFEP